MRSNSGALGRGSRAIAACALSVIAAGVAACSGGNFQSTTANISGEYSVTLTNESNACMFTSWTNGATTQDVHVTFAQSGTTATATVDGVAAAVFDLVLGTATFQGSVQGDSFTLTAIGSNSAKDGMCAYTLKSTMQGSISGATIQGTVTYTETTNGSPDCGYRSTCSSVESFAGVTAPAADGG
jgi:hypothetical protein